MYPQTVDVTARGLSRMLWQWRDKPLINGMFQAFLDNLGVVESLYNQLLTERDIYSAVGVQLDIIGALVGVSRNGLLDELYRQAIFTQIVINTADSTPERSLSLLRIVTATQNVNIFEYFDGVIYYYTGGIANNQTGFIMDQASAAGVCSLVLIDEDGDSLILSELSGSSFNLIDDVGDQIVDQIGDEIVVLNLVDINIVSEQRSYLPEIEDTDLINPLCDLIDKETLTLELGEIIDDVGDNIVDDQGNLIIYVTEV